MDHEASISIDRGAWTMELHGSALAFHPRLDKQDNLATNLVSPSV